jgi:hypothetical protein
MHENILFLKHVETFIANKQKKTFIKYLLTKENSSRWQLPQIMKAKNEHI